METEFKEIIDKASIYISDHPDCLLIKSRFKLFNKINFGVLLINLLSVFVMVVFVLNANDWIDMGLGLLLGGPFFILSLLVALKTITDFVEVSHDQIQFRNRFKKRTFPLDSEMKVRMKGSTSYTKLESQAASGTYFRYIELFLIKKSEEYMLFEILVEEKDAKDANILGSEIIRKIKERILIQQKTR